MPERTLKDLATLPWSWHGPTHLDDEDGDRWELTIAELADFFVAAPTREGVLAEAWPALVAFLRSYTERGEVPPMPPMPGTWRSSLYRVRQLPRVAAPMPQVTGLCA